MSTIEDGTIYASDDEPDVEGHIEGLQDPNEEYISDKSAQDDEEPDVEAHIDGLQEPQIQ